MDDGLIEINENGQKMDRIRKEVIKIFKEMGFKNKIKTNFKDFLVITFIYPVVHANLTENLTLVSIQC